MFAETYRELLEGRPGITDPASVAFRDEEALLGRSSNAEELYVHEILPRKLALSQAYVRQRSLGLDLRLMARTVAAIFGWDTTSEQTSGTAAATGTASRTATDTAPTVRRAGSAGRWRPSGLPSFAG